MRKLFLILTLSLLTIGATYSQVFVSNLVGGTILLGPNNVNCQSEIMVGLYYAQLHSFRPVLEGKKLEMQQNINAIETKRKIRKSDQKKLEKYKLELAEIVSEMELLDTLNDAWMTTLENERTLLTLAKLMDDECFEVKTNQGNYNSDQLEINRVDQSENEYDAFIPISSSNESTTESGRWVRKKKSPNCVSQNRDDCYVACYEKFTVKTQTYHIEDMTGKVFHYTDTTPLSMECDRQNKMFCIKSKIKDVKSKLSLKSIDSDENLEIISWQKIECSSKK